MARPRLGGLLIIFAFLFVIAASTVFPASYFMARDASEREAILSAHRAGWVAASWLWMAGGVAAAAGVLLVALTLRKPLALAGASVYALGCAFWVMYAYLRSSNPAFSAQGLWMEATFGWLTAVAMALLGIAFLQTSLPKWVAFTKLGYALLFLVAFLVMGSKLFDVFPPQVVFLVSVPMGMVALKNKL